MIDFMVCYVIALIVLLRDREVENICLAVFVALVHQFSVKSIVEILDVCRFTMGTIPGVGTSPIFC